MDFIGSPTHVVLHLLYMEKRPSLDGRWSRSPRKRLYLVAGKWGMRATVLAVSETEPAFSVDGCESRRARLCHGSPRPKSCGTESSNHLLELLRNGELQKCFEFLESTISLGMVPHVVACSNVIWGFIKVGQAGKAQRAMDIIEGAGLDLDVKTYNGLINALCKDGEVNKALDVLDHMKVAPNVITCNTIMSGLCKCGKFEQALDVLGRMKVDPDVITYNTILDGMYKHGKLEQALNALESMKVAPNVITNTIMNGLCKHGKLEAQNVLNHMKVAPNVVTYNILFHSLCKTGKINQAVDLWHEMQGKELKPNMIMGFKADKFTYSILVKGIASEGFTKEAEELWYQLRAKGVL